MENKYGSPQNRSEKEINMVQRTYERTLENKGLFTGYEDLVDGIWMDEDEQGKYLRVTLSREPSLAEKENLIPRHKGIPVEYEVMGGWIPIEELGTEIPDGWMETDGVVFNPSEFNPEQFK